MIKIMINVLRIFERLQSAEKAILAGASERFEKRKELLI